MPPEWYDGADPHHLIGNYDYMTARTQGTDTWEVWVCDPIGPSSYSSLSRFLTYTPRMVTDWLSERSNIVPYFDWLSDGQYRPEFTIGGTVTPDMSNNSFRREYGPIKKRQEACMSEVLDEAGNSTSDGVLIVDTTRAVFRHIGLGWSGAQYCVQNKCEAYIHEASGRFAYVDGGVWIDTYIHEIGHALNWSHSSFYIRDEEHSDEYSNPMDVMSGSEGWAGTIAINRYAAGWITSDDVAIWELGDESGTYRLDPVGTTGGYQMLVVRDNHSTWYYTLGARVKKGFDLHLPRVGIEVYMVDESVELANCGWEGWDWCPGTGRYITALGELYSTDHVFGVDEATALQLWDGNDWTHVTVTVRERKGDSFRLEVEG